MSKPKRTLVSDRNVAGPFRQRDFHPCQTVAVGCDGAQHRHFGFTCARPGRVQIDAVQVVAGFLGRDRKAGAVDQHPQIGGRQGELMRQLAARHLREILGRQAAELEVGAARTQRQQPVVAGAVQFHLAAVRQLPHDIVERVSGSSGRTGLGDLRRDRFDDLQVHVGGGQRQLTVFGPEHDVGQDGNGVPAFHHTLNMPEGAEEGCAFDRDFHSGPLQFSLGVISWSLKPVPNFVPARAHALGLPAKRGANIAQRTKNLTDSVSWMRFQTGN